MGNLLELVRAAVKLRRGRCTNCRATLPDNRGHDFCGDVCADEYLNAAAY